ncbi:MAG: hypothetical protein KatS3mg027_1411 [Bacteroidia bacterium]|nr:MAG: hypothetical protein KatS3mg027_1411 [Bacteroidia bacterium]
MLLHHHQMMVNDCLSIIKRKVFLLNAFLSFFIYLIADRVNFNLFVCFEKVQVGCSTPLKKIWSNATIINNIDTFNLNVRSQKA